MKKGGIKNKKDSKNIKNINKEDFLHQAQVHSINYKNRIKPKSTLAAIKRESSQKEKKPPTLRALSHEYILNLSISLFKCTA